MRMMYGIGLLGFLGLTACSTIARYPGAKETSELWNQMSTCAKEENQNSLRSACADRFKDKPLIVQLEKVSLLPGGALELITNFGDPARSFTCTVEGKKYRDQVASIGDGQILTIQGQLKSYATFGNASFTATFLTLNPCEILNR